MGITRFKPLRRKQSVALKPGCLSISDSVLSRTTCRSLLSSCSSFRESACAAEEGDAPAHHHLASLNGEYAAIWLLTEKSKYFSFVNLG